MSSELTPLDMEDNEAVDMLLEMGDVGSWDLDTDIMDVLDICIKEEDKQEAEQLQQQLAVPGLKLEPEGIQVLDGADIAKHDVLDSRSMVTGHVLDLVNGEDLDMVTGHLFGIVKCEDLDMDIDEDEDLEMVTGHVNCEDLDMVNGHVLHVVEGEGLDMVTGDGLDIATGDYLDIIVADEPDIVTGDGLGVTIGECLGLTIAEDDGTDLSGESPVVTEERDDVDYRDDILDTDFAGANLIELIPQSSIIDESYLTIEEQLAQLDGDVKPTDLIEVVEVLTPSQKLCQLGMIESWSVVAPLVTNTTVEVLRLCFARINGNEYRIYDALDNLGYQPMYGGPLVIDGINSKEDLPDGHQLLDDYFHIFPYTSLPQYVKQMILDETGADVVELMNNSDCQLGIDLVQDAEWNIMCVGRREQVAMEVRSEIVPMDEPHSGINVFGEATRVSLTILNTEIVFDNQDILEMTHDPETNIFFYASSSNIYILSGRILFENTDLGDHVLPISNIDLIPFSPPRSADQIEEGRGVLKEHTYRSWES